MSKNARDNRPYIRPVTRLELSEQNIKLRWLAIAVLLVIAVTAIGYGFYSALSVEPGWQEVTVHPDEVSCSEDFVLMYDFSVGDINATAAYKKLEVLYSDLTVEAHRLFSPDVVGVDNVYALNRHVNETVTVAPALYDALSLLTESGSRHAFLAPVTTLYNPVFLSEGDGEAMAFDPMHVPELAAIVSETVAYCADSSHISLELLGDNQVKLAVSYAYLAFAAEYGIETFFDFGWMVNAFRIDFMADALQEAGVVYGYLVSYDGFTRNLDITGRNYSVNFFDRQEMSILMPATLQYSGPKSIVSLRDYPLSDKDRWHYYSYTSGEITTVFLDPADGISKSATDSLMAYSAFNGCGEMLLRLAPVFTADSLDISALTAMAKENVYTIWSEGDVLYHTQEEPDLILRPDSGGEGYTLSFVK